MALWRPRSAAGFWLDYYGVCLDAGMLTFIMPSNIWMRRYITAEDVRKWARMRSPKVDDLVYLHGTTRYRDLDAAIATCLEIVDARSDSATVGSVYRQFLREHGLDHGFECDRVSDYCYRELTLAETIEQKIALATTWNMGLRRAAMVFTNHLLGMHYAGKNRPPDVVLERFLLETFHRAKYLLDWYVLSPAVPLEFIFAHRDWPWSWFEVSRSDWLGERHIDEHPFAPWDWETLAINNNLSREWLQRQPAAAPYLPQTRDDLRDSLHDRPLRGIWWRILRSPNVMNPAYFVGRYVAAGILQRCWRRHRERLRRRAFVSRYLVQDPTTQPVSYFAVLPRDLQWLVYRYTRPPAVLRGLPRALW